VYNLFDWPARHDSNLIVIGIANTMDLPERLLPRVHSRLGMGREIFQPYKSEHIAKILRARLEGLELFDAQSVTMCAKKVASYHGDVRRALTMCRRAAEICWQDYLNPKTDASQLESQTQARTQGGGIHTGPRVRLQHVSKAAEELRLGMDIQILQAMPLFERLLMVAIYNHVMANSQDRVLFVDIWPRFENLCRQVNTPCVLTKRKLRMVVGRLVQKGVLSEERRAGQLNGAYKLGLENDDVKSAFSNDPMLHRVVVG
jgi:origin recognition complex subunit 1